MNLVGKPYAGKPPVRFDEGCRLSKWKPASTLPFRVREKQEARGALHTLAEFKKE